MAIPLGEFQRLMTGTFGNTLIAEAVADTLTEPSRGLDVNCFSLGYNGSNWDRWRNNLEFILLALAERTATTITANFSSHNGRGLSLYLRITARTVGAAPLINVRVRMVDPVSGAANAIAETGNFEPTLGSHTFQIYPGLPDVTGKGDARANEVLPRTFHVEVRFVADVTSLTYSLGGCIHV